MTCDQKMRQWALARVLATSAGLMLLTAGCSGGDGDGTDAGTDPNGGGTDAGTLYRGVLPSELQAHGFTALRTPQGMVGIGSGQREGGAAGAEIFLARFDDTGAIDTSFGEGGVTLLDAQGTEEVPFVGTLNSDGMYAAVMDGEKLVTAGTARAWTIPGAGSLALGRFNADGSVDPAFGNLAGLRLDTFRNGSGGVIEAAFHTLHRLPNGKLLAGGAVQGNFLVVRYNADGSPDTTFAKEPGMGFGGAHGSSLETEAARALVVQSTGKVVLAGGDGFHSMRVNEDGTHDLSYGQSGYFRRSGGTQFALFERPDGKLLHVGTRSESVGGETQLQLALYLTNADGVADASFGTEGLRTHPVPVGIIRGAVQAADGSVYLYLSGGGTYLARLTPSLALDSSFGPEEGLRKLDIKLPILQPLNETVNHLVLDGDALWIADISQEKYAEPDKVKAFFILRRYPL